MVVGQTDKDGPVLGTAAITRQKLIETGQAAFAQRGHDGVSLQRDILEPAGVSTGSFYHQFRDKTDLLVAILVEASERGQGLMAMVGSTQYPDDPVTAVRQSYETWFAMIDRGEEIFRIQTRERQNPDPRVRSMIAQVGEGWMASLASDYADLKGTPDDFDPAMTARLVAALSMGCMIQYLDTPLKQRPALKKQFVDHLVDFTLGGFYGLGVGRK